MDAAVQENAAKDKIAGTPVATDAELDTLVAEQQKDAETDGKAVDARTQEILKELGGQNSTQGGSDDMTSTNFRLNPSDLSPSQKKYNQGTGGNLKTILANVGKYLLIATTTIAVLSIVIGGLMISTTGPSDRAAKGKTIIMLNIMAVVVALFSYSIIRLVSWLIA